MKVQNQRFYKNRIKKEEQRKKNRKFVRQKLAKQKQAERSKGAEVFVQIYETIKHFFPNLIEEFSWIEDPRKKKSEHPIEAMVCAGLLMFLFKQDSRNDFNSLTSEAKFKKTILRAFGLRLPHMDSVERVFRVLDDSILEKVKTNLIHVLLRKKVFHPFRHFKKYFQVVYDATGVVSFHHKHCDCCTHKTSGKGRFILSESCLESLKSEGVPAEILSKLRKWKDVEIQTKKAFSEQMLEVLTEEEWSAYGNLLIQHAGKTTWFHNVLEAKLVVPNGFCVSLGTEWIANGNTEYEKQDCERKAFVRLAKRVKQEFPRLPIITVADGLYPHRGFFEICQEYQWEFVVVLKDGNLPSIWKQVHQEIEKGNLEQKKTSFSEKSWVCDYLNDLTYQKFILSWVQCEEKEFQTDKKEEKTTKFVYLTSFQVDQSNVDTIIAIGRLRQKIENEGFNTQKNHGYHLQHKFSRVSFHAMKNYYQCLQIAHLINQLMELSNRFQTFVQFSKNSLKYLWKCLFGFLIYQEISEEEIQDLKKQKLQYRYC